MIIGCDIGGVIKYQNDQVSKVTICDSWNDIYNMLCDIQ